MDFTPRQAGMVGVLALVPVLAYGLLRGNAFAGAVTTVNVLIIAYCLWTFTRPAEGDAHGHGDEGHAH